MRKREFVCLMGLRIGGGMRGGVYKGLRV